VRLHLEHALLDDGVQSDVLLEIEDGRIKSVGAGGQFWRREGEVSAPRRQFPRAPGETDGLPGLTLPGFANCHSHAFHRALRGHTQTERGSFWTWREQMYDVAAGLTPDSYFELARDTYAEMRATGITAVGEFHYLHHQPDGTPYADPNEMGKALLAAADEAGLRIRLLDTCYLASGFGSPPEGVQVRYSDGDAWRWAERVAAFDDRASVRPSTRCGRSRATSCPSSSRPRRASRCTSISPSRSRRTTRAWPRPA